MRYTTADALLERGWAKQILANTTDKVGTVIIPTNSSIMSYHFTFAPQTVRTIFGENSTVRWINMDGVTNDITSDDGSFRSGPIESGYAWTHTFDKAGIYDYHSEIHPWLKGTVVVTANPWANMKNDTGTITLGNETYYFETPAYSPDAYNNHPQILFHNVTFTLFPTGFRGGLPAIHCGMQGPGLGEYYWVDSKFPDNTHELLHLFAYSPWICDKPIPSMFSNHTNPQAGLGFYEGKMKILVNEEGTNASQQNVNTALTGTIKLQNGTFDFLVLNSTLRSYHDPALQITFDGVRFNLLPSPWTGGPCGTCSGNQFRAEAEAGDGSYIPLDIFISDNPYSANFTTTSLGWHDGLGVGLTISQGNLMILVSKNQNNSGTEKIRIIPEYPITTGISENGTITDSQTIEILFDNFKQNLPLVVQILNPQGGIYKTDNIPSNDIQPDGFYKYQINIKGNESTMGKYSVIATHGNATASISTWLSNAVPQVEK